ncbi:30S ribosomal protein S1 [Breznakiellaceae bacterium SP9]
MVIAIDGPAGTGKSTIAKMLAVHFHYTYVNSGNLYRAITLGCIRKQLIGQAGAEAEYAQKARIEYTANGEVILERENVTALLHTDEIDASIGALSSIVPIRHRVNALIQSFSSGLNIVVEGRDMTTVVFPDAEYRFYLDASARVRSQRRFEQGVSELSLEAIEAAIRERDEIDKNKTEGSLKIAKGVVYLDTSLLTITQVYDKLVREITDRQIEGKNMAQMEVASDLRSADTSPMDDSEGVKPAAPDNIQTQLQEEYLKSLGQLEEGQLVEGTIIQLTQDHVFVNIGYKSEGKIPIGEFAELPKEGDTVSVILVTKESKHGEVIVSKQKADVKLFWKNLRQAFADKTVVQGTIEKQVKGGYDVNMGCDVRAFLPISQSDTQKVDRPEKILGLKTKLYVERLYSENKVNIVVNRRKWLEEEIERKRNEFFVNTQIGDDVDGVVKSFTSFGAFIDLGGFDGLLHINDMSWGHVTRPKDFVKKGQKIHLKVIRIDPADKRINLSLKHFTDDPWVHFEDKYHVNDIIKGKVTKLTEFGAFIELEEGIEGLAHISEFSWVKKIQKPDDVLHIGDETECMVLGYDLQAGRVSLGLKQVTSNPWDAIDTKYPIGTRLTRKVVKLTNVGAFIELEEGIDGFLHGEDLSWIKKIKHPGSELEQGQEIEVMVIGIDHENHGIRLGVKQLSDDPWRSFAASYKPGSLVEGDVSSITDFGIFVRVPGGIEGLIHKSNLVENRDDNQDEVLKKYKVGDKVKAVVLEVQGDKQKVAFSIRDYQKKIQRDEISRYMAGEETGDSTYTLGSIIRSKGEQNPSTGAGTSS